MKKPANLATVLLVAAALALCAAQHAVAPAGAATGYAHTVR